MTEQAETSAPEAPAQEATTSGPSEETLARARALKAKREARTNQPTKTDSKGARILVAGAATSAAIVMVGAMAVAAQAGQATVSTATERVIVVEIPVAAPAATPAANTAGAQQPAVASEPVTVVRTIKVLQPAPNDAPAEAATASSGS